MLIWAIAGGAAVLVGLAMEKLADWMNEKFLAPPLKPHKTLGEMGWGLLMIGITIEISDAGFTALDAWEMSPLNRPMRTISAYAHIIVKGDKWVRPPPQFTNTWYGGIAFLIGTNSTGSNEMFSLSAEGSDLRMVNILGSIEKGRTDREYNIEFHQNHIPEDFMKDSGIGKPARLFNDIGCFVISMPQLETGDPLHLSTNTEVLSGSIEVTINSSLTWTFDIPPQRQKFGFMSGKTVKNAKGVIETQIMPLSVSDMAGKHIGFFDGK